MEAMLLAAAAEAAYLGPALWPMVTGGPVLRWRGSANTTRSAAVTCCCPLAGETAQLAEVPVKTMLQLQGNSRSFSHVLPGKMKEVNR